MVDGGLLLYGQDPYATQEKDETRYMEDKSKGFIRMNNCF